MVSAKVSQAFAAFAMPTSAPPAVLRLARVLVLAPTDLAQRALELRGDDPDLVRRALRDLRQRLHVLAREQLRVGVAGMDRLEDGADRLVLAFRLEDRRLPLALRAQHGGLLLALGGEDRRLLLPLRLKNRRALIAVRAHLLLHRVLDRGGRVDRLQLDAVDADPPLPRRLVQHAAQLAVDLVA